MGLGAMMARRLADKSVSLAGDSVLEGECEGRRRLRVD